jgi:methionyl-tRNA formyltransferase
VLEGVVLLAAFSARSQAYAQALRRAGLAPARVVTFGTAPGAGDPVLPTTSPQDAGGLFLPDPDEPLLTTIEDAGWNHRHLEADSIGDPSVLAALKELAPKLVIYSGYGGQLVPAKVLADTAPFLHMHAGWLPDFRGSTTVYYSWLERGDCGVSAIILDPEIDEGPILARRRYPPPPPGVDVDRIYDNAMRADLLADVLAGYAKTGGFEVTTQSPDDGETYYVIHPVLKHIALLMERTAP